MIEMIVDIGEIALFTRATPGSSLVTDKNGFTKAKKLINCEALHSTHFFWYIIILCGLCLCRKLRQNAEVFLNQETAFERLTGLTLYRRYIGLRKVLGKRGL